jgi:hypothetical protein
MNEIDLIIRWLEKNSGQVDDVCYYHEFAMVNAGGAVWRPGIAQGGVINHDYYFGNLTIETLINGVIVLTDRNRIAHIYSTIMSGNVPLGEVNIMFAINSGADLLGDGVYMGNKKIFQVGFNRLDVVLDDFGAATFVQNIHFNGFMFRMK